MHINNKKHEHFQRRKRVGMMRENQFLQGKMLKVNDLSMPVYDLFIISVMWRSGHDFSAKIVQ